MRKLVVCVLVVFGLVLLTASVASASTPTLKSLAKSVAALQKQVSSLKSQLSKAKSALALAPYLSVTKTAINGVAGPNVVFKGCNLQIKSRTRESDSSGTGNLIVGWDEAPSSTPSGYRSGSNNLVCGDYNSFPSYGGFLAGTFDQIDGIFDSVSGGEYNTTSAAFASVGGGASNTASGVAASVSGSDFVDEGTDYGWSAGGSFHNP